MSETANYTKYLDKTSLEFSKQKTQKTQYIRMELYSPQSTTIFFSLSSFLCSGKKNRSVGDTLK